MRRHPSPSSLPVLLLLLLPPLPSPLQRISSTRFAAAVAGPLPSLSLRFPNPPLSSGGDSRDHACPRVRKSRRTGRRGESSSPEDVEWQVEIAMRSEHRDKVDNDDDDDDDNRHDNDDDGHDEEDYHRHREIDRICLAATLRGPSTDVYLFDIPPTPTSSKITLPLGCVASSALVTTTSTSALPSLEAQDYGSSRTLVVVESLFSFGLAMPPGTDTLAGVVEIYVSGYALFHNGANVSLVPTDGVFLMYDDEEEDNGQHSSSLTPAALSTATRSLSLAINVKALNAKDAQLKERQTVYREEEMQGHMLLSAFPEQAGASVDRLLSWKPDWPSFSHSEAIASALNLTPLGDDSGVYLVDIMSSSEAIELGQHLATLEELARRSAPSKQGPNSMNRYGIKIREIGASRFVETLFDRVLRPLAAMLYPQWAGHHLDSWHAFTVRYKPGEDIELARHMDESEVTLNLCLGLVFQQGQLYFDDVRDEEKQDKKGDRSRLFVDHRPGVAAIHVGQHWHGALPITEGERLNLIIWARSDCCYRASPIERYHREHPHCLDRTSGRGSATPRASRARASHDEV